MKANFNAQLLKCTSSKRPQPILQSSSIVRSSEFAPTAVDFERWCRSQGLLTEINDDDYQEPKVATIAERQQWVP